jgi:hypothetical protein
MNLSGKNNTAALLRFCRFLAFLRMASQANLGSVMKDVYSLFSVNFLLFCSYGATFL